MENEIWIVKFITYITGMVVCGACILVIIENAVHGYGWNWNCLILFTGLFVVFSRLYDKLFVEE